MILQNLTTSDSVTLPDDLLWTDEHSYTPVVAAVDYSITGALLVETAARQAGRTISLSAPDTSMAWLPRSSVEVLTAWYAVAGLQMLLTLADGRVFTVAFRHQDAPALDATPVRKFATPDPDHDWQVTLKFMEL
jgi:hypothetical protein